MIQNFITDPLLHNYMAPCYPIFIQIRYLLGTITNKKTMKTAKSDIVSVCLIFYFSLSNNKVLRLKDLYYSHLWK